MTISTPLLKRLAYGLWGLILAIALQGIQLEATLAALALPTRSASGLVPITVVTDGTTLPIDPAAAPSSPEPWRMPPMVTVWSFKPMIGSRWKVETIPGRRWGGW